MGVPQRRFSGGPLGLEIRGDAQQTLTPKQQPLQAVQETQPRLHQPQQAPSQPQMQQSDLQHMQRRPSNQISYTQVQESSLKRVEYGDNVVFSRPQSAEIGSHWSM